MQVAFDRRRRTMVGMLNDIDGRRLPGPAGRVLRVPLGQGRAGPDDPRRHPATSAELAELILDEAEVAVVPGEAFGPSGYLRLSYALGDDDLAEGVSRLQKLLAEAR